MNDQHRHEPGTSDQHGRETGTSHETKTFDVLARRYHALLRVYPTAWREERGDELLGTLLDAAEPGRRRPSVRESASIVRQGLLERLGLRRRRTPGDVWAEGLRIGALLLLAQAFTAAIIFLMEAVAHPDSPGWLATQAAAILIGGAAMAALIRGRPMVSAVLTAPWCAVPALHGGVSWDLAVALLILIALCAVRPADRRRTSTVWLAVVPLIMSTWFGYHLATGEFISPADSLLYVVALLLAITAGVAFDPRLPIAVACLSVVVMLHNSLHVSAPLAFGPGQVVGRLSPQALVFAGIAVVLLTIGHLRARRLARI